MDERLRAFLIVLERGSITAAAAEMNYSPSGVSRMIEKLERELGVKLLVRTKSGIVPTDACERLVPQFERALYEVDRVRQTAAEIRGVQVGTVTVGTAYRFLFPWLKKATDAFRESHPGVRFHFRTGFSTQLCEDLKAYKMDLAIISRRENAPSWLPLTSSDMVAWVPADSRFAELPAFPLGEFATAPYIEIYGPSDTDNQRILEAANIRPNVRMRASDDYAAFTMVASGLGVAFNERCNSEFRSRNVRILPVTPAWNVEIGAAMVAEPAPAAEAFLHFLESRKGELRAGGAQSGAGTDAETE